MLEFMVTNMSAKSRHTTAAFFLDFKAAFPSVIHGFLIDVMKFIGIPVEIMAFIQNLYANNRCSMIVGGERLDGFTMECGIRQGCPLPPLIFAVVVDVLLLRHAACSQAPP